MSADTFRDAIALALANRRNDLGRGASVVYLRDAGAILAMPEMQWLRRFVSTMGESVADYCDAFNDPMSPAVREWVQS